MYTFLDEIIRRIPHHYSPSVTHLHRSLRSSTILTHSWAVVHRSPWASPIWVRRQIYENESQIWWLAFLDGLQGGSGRCTRWSAGFQKYSPMSEGYKPSDASVGGWRVTNHRCERIPISTKAPYSSMTTEASKGYERHGTQWERKISKLCPKF